MSATWAYDESGHPLLPGASPAAIRLALLPEDRELFDAAYEEALAQARESLELTELFKRLEHWRRVSTRYTYRPARALVTSSDSSTGTGCPVDASAARRTTRR